MAYFGTCPTISGSKSNSMSDRKESGIFKEYDSLNVFVQLVSTPSKYDKISLLEVKKKNK